MQVATIPFSAFQFEYTSQHLVFANCIPLVLKFFNQNINSYVTAKNTITLIDFPSCVLGEQPELTAESLVSPKGNAKKWMGNNERRYSLQGLRGEQIKVEKLG